ncbi:inorganic triphosphatase [Pokkaliibacter sp. CJK22405]|uniref:CYTH domain-containing protein n=1 Tax=Pokkaliibacter sp. CJK22405 TaxID=3384615 RepID=UPI00398512AD
MTKETELKLSIAPEFADQLAALPLLQGARYQGKRVLFNRYFDTPDLALQRNKVALRIRRDGDTYLQTLKTQGTSQGGVHQRGEWEMPIPEARLDLSLFPQEELPGCIAQDGRLEAAFTTDFERHQWLIQVEGAEVEMVLDRGEIHALDRTAPLCEVELELKKGDVAALFDVAYALSAEIPLFLCDISKAERGYGLYTGHCLRDPSLPQVESGMTQEQVYRTLFAYYLTCWQRHWEIYNDKGLMKDLEAIRHNLRALTDVMLTFADVIPMPDVALSRELAHLEARITDMLAFKTVQELTGLEHSALIKQQRQRLRERWLELAADPMAGQLQLMLGQWLVLSIWQAESTPEQHALAQNAFIG